MNQILVCFVFIVSEYDNLALIEEWVLGNCYIIFFSQFWFSYTQIVKVFKTFVESRGKINGVCFCIWVHSRNGKWQQVLSNAVTASIPIHLQWAVACKSSMFWADLRRRQPHPWWSRISRIIVQFWNIYPQIDSRHFQPLQVPINTQASNGGFGIWVVRSDGILKCILFDF